MAELYPWVTRLKRPRQCQGWVTNASWTRGKETCKRPAHWKFRFSARADLFGTSRGSKYFCWQHLLCRGLYGEMGEYERTITYTKKHDEKFKKYTDLIDELRDR